jgi:hypothetical protein
MTRRAVYRFEPVGLDRFDRRPYHPARGSLVILTPKGDRNLIGCPPQGTMGHVFISDAESGRFLGLVLRASLVRAGES